MIDFNYTEPYALSADLDEAGELQPSICFHIVDTVRLTQLADKIRIAKGLRPMLPSEDVAAYDENGWYDFSFKVKAGKSITTELSFVVDSSDAPDDLEEYVIAENQTVKDELLCSIYHELEREGITLETLLFRASLQYIQENISLN